MSLLFASCSTMEDITSMAKFVVSFVIELIAICLLKISLTSLSVNANIVSKGSSPPYGHPTNIRIERLFEISIGM